MKGDHLPGNDPVNRPTHMRRTLMGLIEWEVNENTYQEQIVIPKMLEGAGRIRIQLL